MMPPEKNVYEQYSDAVNRQRIVGDLLKFSKGEWLTGKEAMEAELGTELVAGCDGLEIGWIKWRDFKPQEYLMGRLAEGFKPSRREELGDHNELDWERDEQTGQPRDPWQLSNSLLLMDPETRQLYTYAAASKGGINAIGKLMGIYGKSVRQAPNKLPVVALDRDSYMHSNKAYGKIYTPVLKVTRWVDRAEFDAVLNETAGLDEAKAEAETETQTAPEKAPPAKDYAAAKGKRRKSSDEIPF